MFTQIYRGEIYYADLDPVVGSEQGGIRPVLIIQNDVGNQYSPTVIIASITARIKSKSILPIHYFINARSGLKNDSIILLEQLRTIDKCRLLTQLGVLGIADMESVDNLLLISLGIKIRTYHGNSDG